MLPSYEWVPTRINKKQLVSLSPFQRTFRVYRSNFPLYAAADVIDFDSLMDMDVVVYSLKQQPKEADDDRAMNGATVAAVSKKYLGAIQEDGTLSPLSVWSMDPAFGNSLELLVDEVDRFPGLTADQVVIHCLIDQSDLSYGSRQVGGGKGPGNPHGEESELLYYVDKNVIEGIEIPVKPELEILW